MRPTRAAAGRLARRSRIAPECPPLLLGLAPGGVFPAAAVAGGAVRSYRTVSPLPAAPVSQGRPAVYFLWHFPWGRPRRALPGTVPPWSPDFPLSINAKSGHPTVWRPRIWGSAVLVSKAWAGTACGYCHDEQPPPQLSRTDEQIEADNVHKFTR